MRTLRVAIVAVFILFSTMNLHAEGFSFGITAGSSHSDYKLRGEHGAISNHTGFHVGAGATFKVPILSISPEVIYTNNRFEVKDSYILGDRCDVRDQRVDIPIVVGINFLGPLQLEAGPVFTVYSEADAAYARDSYRTWNSLGCINSNMGYVVGLKLSIMDKVMLGTRFYGQGDYSDFANSGYQIKSYSYAFSIGFML